MIHCCPKPDCNARRLIWQPSKMRYYCPTCHRNYQRAEVALIQGGKQ